ncbi:hypothetical protein NDU88_008542 [Pleurodeles waltl]|uniref:Uncharacterized protein n=1 Tax=Pleurodeles waltl TaxID=8319 RepID=A0AAV7PPS3_PLEWA|nr:hypothetical protein NDU88_008542 [Pleurodeles waltl]
MERESISLTDWSRLFLEVAMMMGEREAQGTPVLQLHGAAACGLLLLEAQQTRDGRGGQACWPGGLAGHSRRVRKTGLEHRVWTPTPGSATDSILSRPPDTDAWRLSVVAGDPRRLLLRMSVQGQER